MNYLKNIKILFTFFSVSLLLGACVKKDPLSRIAQVLLVPLSPNTPAIDFSINNTLFATIVGYSTTTGTVRYTLPYYTIEPKESKVAYNLSGTNNAVASVMASLEEDKVYSTFLIDSFSKAKAVIVNDDLSDPLTPGKVKIRFFHFSPNAPAVDVRVVGATTNLYSNRTFNDQSTNTSHQGFIEVDPGSYSYEIRLAGTSTVVYTIPAQSLLPDRIYTIAARGFVGGAGSQALGGWVYPNKP
jgi:hypothetical protein